MPNMIDNKHRYRKLKDNDTLAMLIVGSRSFNNKSLLYSICQTLANGNNIKVISGGAKGADSLARDFAKSYDYEYTEMLADWDRYGKRAGYIRNCEMHKELAKYEHRVCVAFWDGESNGTKHNFDLANKYNTILVIYHADRKSVV